MEAVPPQSPPVFRDPLAADRPDDPDDGGYGHGARSLGGVQASQSQCDNLTGPARSMCYAALYGVYI
jgi:hypothetical protein